MQLKRRTFTKTQERRRHQRVKVVLMGRYMLADRREFPCQTIDISPGGMAVFAPVKGSIGERIIAYIDQLGRIEGTVARHLDNGFAISSNIPLSKRDKLADKLTWLANRHALGMPEDRRHERIIPANTLIEIHLSDGKTYPAKLIDISISGCALTSEHKPSIGTPITVGHTPGQVVRVFDNGVAVEFSRLLPAQDFSPHFIL